MATGRAAAAIGRQAERRRVDGVEAVWRCVDGVAAAGGCPNWLGLCGAAGARRKGRHGQKLLDGTYAGPLRPLCDWGSADDSVLAASAEATEALPNWMMNGKLVE
jgi:hypothetical protein|tara:strand:+ start:151 stop:465 length:315 start_codon:yes stop_codon:yes gene_type:complete